MSVLIKMKAIHATVLILAWGHIGIVPLNAGQVCLYSYISFYPFHK